MTDQAINETERLRNQIAELESALVKLRQENTLLKNAQTCLSCSATKRPQVVPTNEGQTWP